MKPRSMKRGGKMKKNTAVKNKKKQKKKMRK